jgi:hypothetical protein
MPVLRRDVQEARLFGHGAARSVRRPSTRGPTRTQNARGYEGRGERGIEIERKRGRERERKREKDRGESIDERRWGRRRGIKAHVRRR